MAASIAAAPASTIESGMSFGPVATPATKIPSAPLFAGRVAGSFGFFGTSPAHVIAGCAFAGRVACFFGFFSLKSWALVGLMMGGGIAIRNAIVQPGVLGAGILGALYLGIGTALLIADRVFWQALMVPVPVESEPR